MRPCSAVPVAWVQRGPFLARLSPVPGGGGRCYGARGGGTRTHAQASDKGGSDRGQTDALRTQLWGRRGRAGRVPEKSGSAGGSGSLVLQQIPCEERLRDNEEGFVASERNRVKKGRILTFFVTAKMFFGEF